LTNLSAKGYKLFCRGQTLDTVHNGELRFMVAIRQSAMIACYDVCQNDSCDSLRLFGEQIPKAFKVHLRLFLENLGDCCGGCCLFFGVDVKILFAFLLRCKKIIVNCHLSIINLLLPLLHLRADALILCWRLGWLGGDDIMERRLLGALVLTIENLANSDS